MAHTGWFFHSIGSGRFKQVSNDDFSEAYENNTALAETILREFDQNAADAATTGSGREVRICFKTLSPSVISKYLNGNTGQSTLKDHLIAGFQRLEVEDDLRKNLYKENQLGIEKEEPWWVNPRVMIIEDFGTSGLLGGHERRKKEGEENSNLYNFLSSEGEQQKKKDAKGGTHGRGKIIFSLSSRVHSFFGMTCRADMEGKEDQHVCFGKMEFPSTYFATADKETKESIEYTGAGDWGLIDGTNEQSAGPVYGNAAAEDFISDFGFTRGLGEPGLSLCIPWLKAVAEDSDEQMNWTHMFKAVVENLAFVIFDKTLKVTLEDQNDPDLKSPITLTSESLYEEFIKREHLWEDSKDESIKLSRRSQMDLYRQAGDKFRSTRDSDVEIDLEGVDLSRLDDRYLKKEFADTVEHCRSMLDNVGQVVQVRVKIPLVTRVDGKTVKDEFDVFLKNCDHELPSSGKRIGRSLRKNYQRQELAIHKALHGGSHKKADWDRMMMLVHLDNITGEEKESPLHKLMKDTEKANHKEWEFHQSLKDSFHEAKRIYDLVIQGLCDSLHGAMYADEEEKLNNTLLADFLPAFLGEMPDKPFEEDSPPEDTSNEGSGPVTIGGGGHTDGNPGPGRPFNSLNVACDKFEFDGYDQIHVEKGESAEPVKEFYLRFGYDDGTQVLPKIHSREDFDFLKPAEKWETNFYDEDGCTKFEIFDDRTIKVILEEGNEKFSIKVKRGDPSFLEHKYADVIVKAYRNV